MLNLNLYKLLTTTQKQIASTEFLRVRKRWFYYENETNMVAKAIIFNDLVHVTTRKATKYKLRRKNVTRNFFFLR